MRPRRARQDPLPVRAPEHPPGYVGAWRLHSACQHPPGAYPLVSGSIARAEDDDGVPAVPGGGQARQHGGAGKGALFASCGAGRRYTSRVLDPSARLSCTHAPRCGGCPLSALDYGAQLEAKHAEVDRAVRRYPELGSARIQPVVPAASMVGYRVRAKLVVAGASVGLYARGTHEVVDLPDCQLLAPPVAAAVAAIRRLLPFAFPLDGLDVREANEGVLVTLIVPEGTSATQLPSATQLAEAAQRIRAEHPAVLGVSVSRRERNSPRLLGRVPETLGGLARSPHAFRQGAPNPLAVPGSFVQAHAGQAARLHEAVSTALEAALGGLAGRRVLELYAGSGALALELAARGAVVTAVDSHAPGIEALAQAAETQRLPVTVRAAPAELALEALEPTEAVVVDPPRRGLSVRVRKALAERAPRVIALVSCNPSTLARDLAHLAHLGFRTRSLLPLDMIPLSDSVETLALLEPAAPSPAVELYRDETLVAVNKPPHLPTTPQGEHAHDLLAAVRRLPGCRHAVPVHRLDAGTSGVCLFAREPAFVPGLARALKQGGKEYLALVRGGTPAKGRIVRPLPDRGAPREAATRYRRERRIGTHSLVRARPEQGRMHQIRRHFAGIGHPVLGDARYGDPASNRHFEERYGLDRTFLHAARLTLELAGRPVVIEAPLAPDLESVLESFFDAKATAPVARLAEASAEGAP